MAWRVLSTDDGTWGVDPAVERRQSNAWRLVLAFRSLDDGSTERRPTVWAPYPLEGQSQATLYARAEELDDRELIEVLSRSLAQEPSVQ